MIQMLKKAVTIFLLLLLAVFPYLSNIEGAKIEDTSMGTNSFQEIFHSKWGVIKINALEPVVIDELRYETNISQCNGTRGVVFAIFITNFTNVSSDIFGVREYEISAFKEGEFFFHMEFDGFNYTINRLNFSGGFSSPYGEWYNISIPEGTWYLVYMVGGGEKIEIGLWINTTGKVSLDGVLAGNNTFLLSSHEFGGKLNFIIPNILGIWSGTKTFMVNNTFVGSLIGGNCDIKAMHLAVTFPSGETKHSLEIFQPIGRRGWIIGDMSPFFFWGNSGKWKVRIDALLIQFLYDKRFTPWLGFLGADIGLP